MPKLERITENGVPYWALEAGALTYKRNEYETGLLVIGTVFAASVLLALAGLNFFTTFASILAMLLFTIALTLFASQRFLIIAPLIIALLASCIIITSVAAISAGKNFPDVFVLVVIMLMFISPVAFVGTLFYRWGLGKIFAGLKETETIRRMEMTPISKIRSIAMGEVKIQGRVVPVPGSSMKDPINGKECVYYKFLSLPVAGENIVRRRGDAHFEEGSKEFFLEDDTGRVLVDPYGAEIDMMPDLITVAPERLAEFIVHTGKLATEPVQSKKSISMGYIIRPGDVLYVVGAAGDNPHVEEATAARGVEDVMVQKGKGIFKISKKPLEHVSRKLRIAFMLILGLVVSLLAVYSVIGIINGDPLVVKIFLPIFAVFLVLSIILGVLFSLFSIVIIPIFVLWCIRGALRVRKNR